VREVEVLLASRACASARILLRILSADIHSSHAQWRSHAYAHVHTNYTIGNYVLELELELELLEELICKSINGSARLNRSDESDESFASEHCCLCFRNYKVACLVVVKLMSLIESSVQSRFDGTSLVHAAGPIQLP
jgi:hypothetical protein